MKRYLLFLTSLELGGAERQALNFAKYLLQRGNEVFVTGLGQPGKVCEICKNEGITCISTLNEEKIIRKILMICNILTSKVFNYTIWYDGASLSYSLAKVIKENEIDICIAYCSPANTILGNAKKFHKNCIYVWFQRDAGLCYEPIKYRDRALHLCDYVLANSKSGKEWIEKNHNIEATIINNGMIIREPQMSKEEWKKNLQIEDSNCVYTMIANLSSTKDHMVLLKAWKYMYDKKVLENRILVFAGRWDDQYDKLYDFAKENHILDYVRFLGQIEDVSGLLRATKIGVFGAISEGSPNGIIESEFASLPIIATDLPEIREVLSDENNKYLFKKGDIQAIVDNIMKMDSSETLRNKIGEKNREKVEKLFSSKENFNRMVHLLEGKSTVS